jgi:hypothetical protein
VMRTPIAFPVEPLRARFIQLIMSPGFHPPTAIASLGADSSLWLVSKSGSHPGLLFLSRHANKGNGKRTWRNIRLADDDAA